MAIRIVAGARSHFAAQSREGSAVARNFDSHAFRGWGFSKPHQRLNRFELAKEKSPVWIARLDVAPVLE